MFQIQGGKKAFDQWDLNQKVTNESMLAGDRVRFCSNNGETGITYARDDGGTIVADVPNELLRVAKTILVQLGSGAYWKCEHKTTFKVNPAQMPEGYECTDNTYTPDPHSCSGGVTSWVDLEDKPFYEETVKTVLLEEQTVTTAACASDGYRYFRLDYGDGDEPVIDLVVGKEYIVKFDGVEYRCIAQVFDSESNYIGNIAKIDGAASDDNIVDNGLPFCIERRITSQRNDFNIYAGPDNNYTGEDITFSIYLAEVSTSIHPLDPKFLPEHEHEWFAGSAEGTALILKSPSGKRFKVTVDDNGSLTAAEV